MKMINKKCLQCDAEFEVRLAEHKRGRGNFCGHSCSTKWRMDQRAKPDDNTVCAQCSKSFYRMPSKKNYSKSGHYFCSMECKYKSQCLGGIREVQPSHYGTAASERSYRRVALRTYEARCMCCGYDKHPEVLDVHHIDENRQNNAVENLAVLCPNCHREVHLGFREIGAS